MPGLTDRDIGQYYAILLNINLKVVTVDDRRLQHPNCPLRLVGEDARGNQFNIRAYSNNDERLEPVQINHIYTFSKLTVQMARQPFDVVGSPRCAFLIEKYCEMFSLNAQQDEAQLTDLESLVEDKSLWYVNENFAFLVFV
ncbi:hypothetical protein QR680_000706 [Steinernema hermaphroditum]|uniref:Uncharacterized protein n=1 Tax=Steinernema hermaphroditum TaxID=289476 RepID=A0AA39GXK4_9BILA|nr:hypothetical protein QR680_000706 [Steinernema hermaphroditum]